MELIEGTRCDQLITSRLLTMPRAFRILDGVLAGLSAMHSVGVGHLDIKPSNVILRDSGEAVRAPGQAWVRRT
jgi:serine/threonine protein kinase